MAVPKKKVSPSRQGMRRSHRKAKSQAMSSCPHCGEVKKSHHVCLHCGQYRGVLVFMTKAQIRAKKASEETSA